MMSIADDLPASDDLHRGQLSAVRSIERFITAGNARVTVVSNKTGKRFTYSFRRPDPEPGKQRPVWVSLLSGPDNDNDYQYLGTIWPAGLGWHLRIGKSTRVGRDAPSMLAIEWFLRCLTQGEMKGITVYHEGRCGRCGRPLTVPESILSGFGPECINYV